MTGFETTVEQAAIEWLQDLGYQYRPGPEIAPDGVSPERKSYAETILEGRLRAALARINPHLDSDALDEAARKVLRLESPSLEENNLTFHRLLTKGIEVTVRRNGETRGDYAWLVDFKDPGRNDWLVVNQLTLVDGKYHRRPDLVVFLNGMAIAVIELKSAEDPKATLQAAWNQLQTYKKELPKLFATNEILIISDGSKARVGSLTAGFERFAPWRTVDGSDLAPTKTAELDVVLAGLFEKQRLLDYIQGYVLWETDDGFIKKIAGYHQFHAVRKAVTATVRASQPSGDKRIGVVWHTQGSGKSILMTLFTGRVIVEPAMENPTIVVITDRNDLDGQLFGQFCKVPDLVPGPVQAESREHLRSLLQVASGGVVFTTIQKFSLNKDEKDTATPFPSLSTRRNIVVMADEAHRSQYGFDARVDTKTGQVTFGLARNIRDALPNASFIGFTGTPIEFDDKSTPAVFGDYIDTYPISQAVEDGATVPIYYEARLARLALSEDEKPTLDEEFEEVTEGEEETSKEKLKGKWAKLEALVGSEKRLSLIADDILSHWAKRLEILDGKAMIVCMSRRICADLYAEITKRHPEWHSMDDGEGVVKVVMTGAASDPQSYQPHIRNKARLKDIEKRFKDPEDPLKLVIVRDMWLTGFDVPCAHTLYIDKPMQGHGLIQAIARVNRVFKDKPSGLVVDYLGLADQLRKAVGAYDGRSGETPGLPVEMALQVLKEKVDVVRGMLHGYDYQGFFSTKASARLNALTGGMDHIFQLEEGKKRFLDAMHALNKAAGISLHLEGARSLRDEVGYFQAIQRQIQKYTVGGSGQSADDLNAAIRQIVSGAITSDGVIDIFDQAGIKRPDLSILSDEFLETVRVSEHKNLQLELLKKLLKDELKRMTRTNVVQARAFSEMLEKTLLAYQNRTIESAQVILELIRMAKEMRDAPKRGAALGLTDDELAFYDALVAHGGVREVMSDQVLAAIAHDLVDAIKASVAIDWTQKESVRARMRTKIKQLLRKHGYPPDKREAAVLTVIEQAEEVCRDWAMVG